MNEQAHDPDPEVPEKAKRRQFSTHCTAEVLRHLDQLLREQTRGLPRREGLYSSNITEWRQMRDRGALEALARPWGAPG